MITSYRSCNAMNMAGVIATVMGIAVVLHAYGWVSVPSVLWGSILVASGIAFVIGSDRMDRMLRRRERAANFANLLRPGVYQENGKLREMGSDLEIRLAQSGEEIYLDLVVPKRRKVISAGANVPPETIIQEYKDFVQELHGNG